MPAETGVDWLNGTRPLPPFHDSTFTLNNWRISGFGIFLRQLLHYDILSNDSIENSVAEFLSYPANISEVMANVAESVTIYLRQNNRNATTAWGDVWQQVTIVEVRWAWLILPALVISITAALLIAAILSSKSDISAVTSWKSSSLPFLFHGIRDWGHDEWEALRAGEFESIKQMNAVAATMDVSLREATGSGTALARHNLGAHERKDHRPTSRQEQ